MTFIFVPSNSHLEAEVSAAECRTEGYFTLQARNRFGRLLRERTFKVDDYDRSIGPFHNLILNQGMDRLSTNTSNNTYNRCSVGVGTLAPAVTQTALANFVSDMGTPSTTNGTGPAPEYYSWRRITWTTAIGAIPTNNLSEIGVGSSTTNNNNLFSRELIRDAQGVPTVFPISSDEQLTVTYELRLYPPLGDTPATITVGATSYDTITRAFNIAGNAWGFNSPSGSTANFAASSGTTFGLYTGDMVENTTASNPTGNLGSASNTSNAAYTPGSYQRDISATWSITNGNGSIRTARMSYGCAQFQVRYDPVLVKTNTQTMTLNHRISWARR